MTDSFVGISIEQRDHDDMNKGRFNVRETDKERIEYFSKTHKTDRASKGKTTVGRSLNKAKWNITEYDNDKKSERTESYGDHTMQSVMMDFGVDATPLLRNKMTKSAKAPAKKPAKKKSKKGGKSTKKSKKRKKRKSKK